ncbi:PREDICTED: methionine--tRNA ligase, cytoplasmic-like [Acropora digitifera]|uniref:methionine--tRNA ligase, cytoplasmic-like n=1 Tax=Acropora digitifera TaxID=70779 RepID=UPI00077AE4D0|nr:PREDICTED: methionine--tRNA ligase, cytoplasmic-like [Acropora digitifera]
MVYYLLGKNLGVLIRSTILTIGIHHCRLASELGGIMKLYSDRANPLLLRILAARNLSGVPLTVHFINDDEKQEFELPGSSKFPVLQTEDGNLLNSANSICSVWLWFIPRHSTQMYGASAALGFGSSISLVTVLTMLADLIAENVDQLGLADVVLWGSVHPLLAGSVALSGLHVSNLSRWHDHLTAQSAFCEIESEVNSAHKDSKAQETRKAKQNERGSQEPREEKRNVVLSEEASQPKVCSKEEVDEAFSKWEDGAKKRPKARRLADPILPLEGERNILITSALPYVNNVPHLGNIIGCVLSADVFARYCRLRQYNTLYICGTDEYGTATETKALEEGLSPQQICDKYFKIHKEVYEWFNIKFDYFGRTTTQQQTEIAQDIFWRLYKQDHLVEDTLEQLQCGDCKRFLADRFVEGTCPFCGYEDARGDQCDACGKLINAIELKNPRCKVCGGTPLVRTSKHLFLNLTKLESSLQSWIDKSSSEGTWTTNARHITRGWLQEGLKPRCITRDLKWGTPVPLEGYTDKVFYVWFDAPIGYLSITANYTKEWEKWWKNPQQVSIGHDGGGGEGDFLSLQDSAFSWTDFVLKNNSELLNNFGNFVNRALMFVYNNFDATIPTMDLGEEDKNFIALINRELKSYIDNNERMRMREGLKDVLNMSKLGNQYIQSNKPWVLVKGSEVDRSRAGTVLGVATNLSWLLSVVVLPYMPEISEEIQRQLQVCYLCACVRRSLPRFVTCFHGKNRVTTAIMLSLDDTLDDEDVLVIFDELQVRAKYGGSRQKEKAANNKTKTSATAGGDKADTDVETLLAEVTKQGEKVRKLKADKAEKEAVDSEVAVLLELKRRLAVAEGKDPNELDKKAKKKGGKK